MYRIYPLRVTVDILTPFFVLWKQPFIVVYITWSLLAQHIMCVCFYFVFVIVCTFVCVSMRLFVCMCVCACMYLCVCTYVHDVRM